MASADVEKLLSLVRVVMRMTEAFEKVENRDPLAAGSALPRLRYDFRQLCDVIDPAALRPARKSGFWRNHFRR